MAISSLIVWQAYFRMRVQHIVTQTINSTRTKFVPIVDVDVYRDVTHDNVFGKIVFRANNYRQIKQIDFSCKIDDKTIPDNELDRVINEELDALPAWLMLNIRAAEKRA